MRAISRHAASARTANSIVESGRARVEEQRQVDGRGQARSPMASVRPGPAAGRAPRRRPRPAARRGPARARRRRPTTTWAAAKVAPSERHRDRREERRQRQPDLERRPREDERRRLVAPQRVGHEAAALDQVARDADVVGGVLGLREDDLRRDDGADHERDDEDRRARTSQASRRVTASASQRVSSARRCRPGRARARGWPASVPSRRS